MGADEATSRPNLDNDCSMARVYRSLFNTFSVTQMLEKIALIATPAHQDNSLRCTGKINQTAFR